MFKLKKSAKPETSQIVHVDKPVSDTKPVKTKKSRFGSSLFGQDKSRWKSRALIFIIGFGILGSALVFKNFALSAYGDISSSADELVVRYESPMAHPYIENEFGQGMPPTMLLYGDGLMLCSDHAAAHKNSDMSPLLSLKQRQLSAKEVSSLFQKVRALGFDNLLERDLSNTQAPPAGSTTSVSLITSAGERRVALYPNEVQAEFTAITSYLDNECKKAKDDFNPDDVVLESIKTSEVADASTESIPDLPVPPNSKDGDIRSTRLTGEDAKKAKDLVQKGNKTYKATDGKKIKVRVVPKIPDFNSPDPYVPDKSGAAGAQTYRKVKFLYVVAADQATPSNAQAQLNDLAATLPSYYQSQVGKTFTTESFSIIKGSKSAAQYQACPSDRNCNVGGTNYQSLASYYNLTNEFKQSQTSTIVLYSWTDDNLCIGWGGPIVATDNVNVGDYGFASFSGQKCTSSSGGAVRMLGAHEGGHSFGLVHTCDTTIMDGCGYTKPTGYGAPLHPNQANLLNSSSPYFNGSAPSAPAPVASGTTFVSVSPARLLDTRPGYSTTDGQSAGIGRRPGGSITEVQVAGRAGIPTDALAAALNVTAVSPSGNGFLTVYPCGIGVPGTANINYTAGAVISNAVISKIGGGKICVYSNVESDIVVDINGAFPSISTGSYTNVTPSRILETRSGLSTIDGQFNAIGRLAGGSVTQLQVTGRIGIPTSASAVSLNVAVISPSANGFIVIYPCDIGIPSTASVTYKTGDVISNAVISKLGNGKVCIYTNVATDLIIDINGAFNSVTSFKSVAPGRLLDTRPGFTTVDGQYNGIGTRSGGSVTEVQVAGRANIPGDALAAALNITAVNPQANGFMVVFPCGISIPGTANVNYSAGSVISNAVISKLGNGKICIYTNNTSDIVVDVNGAFTAADTQQYALASTPPVETPPATSPTAPPDPVCPEGYRGTYPNCEMENNGCSYQDASCYSSSCLVTFYTNANYSGTALEFRDGEYTAPTNFVNDTFSSARVQSGCRAILYQNTQYGGATHELVSDWAGGTADPWNDKTSSFIIYPSETITDSTPITCVANGVKIYKDANYAGTSKALSVGRHDKKQISAVGDNRISSVRVAPGCKVILYQNTGFGGATKVLTGDWTSVTGDPWNDITSSVEVRNRATMVQESLEFIKNNGFESGLENWTIHNPQGGFTNYFVYSIPSRAQSGSRFLEMNSNPPGGAVTQNVVYEPLQGATYRLSAWVRSPDCSTLGGALALWSVWQSYNYKVEYFDADCTWRQVSVSLTSQNTSGDVGFSAQLYVNAEPNRNIDIDSVSLVQIRYIEN